MSRAALLTAYGNWMSIKVRVAGNASVNASVKGSGDFRSEGAIT
jgi:hypothetical protein